MKVYPTQKTAAIWVSWKILKYYIRKNLSIELRKVMRLYFWFVQSKLKEICLFWRDLMFITVKYNMKWY